MKNTILIDTNILLDVFLKREPFYYNSNRIFQACLNGELQGVIAAHSFNNIWYIARKKYDDAKLRSLLISLISVFEIESIDKTKILYALENSSFKDFEDCLQDQCAQSFKCDYIITRDTDGFKSSKIKVLMPEDFFKLEYTGRI